MAEDDECEIEYLDEDEELVQQCIQIAQTPSEVANEGDSKELLVERKASKVEPSQRKRLISKTEEEDSDYDPAEDLVEDVEEDLGSDDFRIRKKKPPKRPPKKVAKIERQPTTYQIKTVQQVTKPVKTYTKQVIKKRSPPPLRLKSIRLPTKHPEEIIKDRRKLDIRIPDFEDPLCLPVKAVPRDDLDERRLKQWNNVCLEFLKKGNDTLRTSQPVNHSTRTIVLSNSRNKFDGRVETTVWGKVHVETEDGESKVESFRSVLPRFREKKLLKPYTLYRGVIRDSKKITNVILTKETQKDEDFLVVYKPEQALSAVYKFEAKKNSDSEDEHHKPNLKETTCCKICAPCYQVSWRGVRKDKDSKQDTIPCVICGRKYVSVYNLLSHLKTHHTNAEVGKHRGRIAKALATMVDYHYKCRICQQEFLSIKLLRKHVFTHKGTEVFKCEVGNHMAS